MHITALASGDLHNLSTFVHEVYREEDVISHVVRFRGVVFFSAAIASVVLDMGVDSIDAYIAKVACHSFGSLLHSSSRYCDPSLDRCQFCHGFRAYLEGTIRNKKHTTTLSPVLGSFQEGIVVTALQCAFPGHYLS